MICVGTLLSEEAGGAELDPAEKVLVQCILLRAAYGGMAGDMSMLKDFATLWLHRCVMLSCNV